MSREDNHYFETLNGIQGELTEEVLIARMAECNLVLGELSVSNTWKIVLDDVRSLMQTLDDNWQNIIPGTDKLQEARVMKMVCKHLSDLPNKYLEEATKIEDKLKEIQNPDKSISKDADND